jgi:hypothetical protein
MTTTEAQLEAVAGAGRDEVLAQEGFADGDDAVVYVSGSLFEGYGNPWSDVDVFAITDRPPSSPYAKRASTNRTAQHLVGGRRFDWEFWGPDDVRALAARASALRATAREDILGTAFLHIEKCFIHRLRIGAPLLRRDEFERLRSLFDFDLFAGFQADEAIRWLDSLMEDLCGMLAIEDADVALFTARELVGTAVDAYCHSKGSTDPVRKWRVKQLARVADGSERHAVVAEGFWRLQFPDPVALRSDWERCRSYLEECLRFAERVAAWVQA